MSKEINQPEVTLIREIGEMKVTMHFKNYDDFVDFQVKDGEIAEPIEEMREGPVAYDAIKIKINDRGDKYQLYV